VTGSHGRRLLVRAPNWLGDILMALPALAALRHHFGGDTLALAVPAAYGLLARSIPGVDEVVPLRGGSSWASLRADADTLRAGRFDRGLLLTNSFGSALVFWWAGIPERWGYRRDGRGWLLTRAVPRGAGRTGDSRHHSEYYVRLVRALGVERMPPSPRLRVGDGSILRARRLLETLGVGDRPLVGLAPGAAFGHAKRWPPAQVAALVDRLVAETEAACVLVGSAGDRDVVSAIESRVGPHAKGTSRDPRLVSLVGRTDVDEVMGLIALCRAFVSNDSGAMHLSAAIGVHVTAIFGPTDERATSPLGPHTIVTHDVWCRPCHLRDCPIDHRCMTRIPVDTVFASAKAALDQAAGGASR